MNKLRGLTLLSALFLTCFSYTAHAEKFVAKVKFTLVDPASVTTIHHQENIQIPLKKSLEGNCEIDAQHGKLSGQSCAEGESTLSVLEIGGKQDQSIAVKLNQAEGTTQGLSFQPSLYNGQNTDSNFRLSSSTHAIAIGGQVIPAATTTQIDAEHLNGQYQVEVLYP